MTGRGTRVDSLAHAAHGRLDTGGLGPAAAPNLCIIIEGLKPHRLCTNESQLQHGCTDVCLSGSDKQVPYTYWHTWTFAVPYRHRWSATPGPACASDYHALLLRVTVKRKSCRVFLVKQNSSFKWRSIAKLQDLLVSKSQNERLKKSSKIKKES